MAAALTVLLIGCLLQTALCGKSEVFIPKNIKVLSGSCVTIPCSFDVESKYESYLDGTCRALWKSDDQTLVFDNSNPQSSAIQGELIGDLTRKDCSTTLNNMRPEHSKAYFLRLQCDRLETNYLDKLHISVTDVPPTPTLTPYSLKVEEGTSVNLTCSAPAPCLSHPPALTWSSSLGHIQESLQENPDRTKVQTSVLTFTASRIHHGKEISCTAVYNKQDGHTRSSVSTSLTADISWSTQYIAFMPQTIQVLSGSCVTIPCSFGVEDTYKSKVDETCKAVWKYDHSTVVFDSRNPEARGHLTGNLKNRDCTTTLNNMRPEERKCYFRLECDNGFKYDFSITKVNISVTDVPPTPTLTPSTLKVAEGTSVSLTCSAPAPCLSHPPALTWSSSLGHIQESLQENQDRTKAQTSVMTFTASRIHHGKEISCTAVYNKLDGRSRSSVSASLTLSVSYTPVILSSYDCIQTADQLNCSCETVGNPPPALQWYLSGSPVNHSDRFAISSEPLNVSGLRSIITVNQPQGKDLRLSCHSSNSLGSTTQGFFVSRLEPQACSRRVLLPVFIAIAGGITAALVCALLVAIRAVWRKPTKSECSGDTSRGVMSRGLTGEKENKVSITSEEDIYVNANEMRQSDKPETQVGHQHVANHSSEKQDEEGSNVLYASVVWKSKKKRRKKEDHSGENNLYLEEERCTGKNAQEAVFSEYAQVTFR